MQALSRAHRPASSSASLFRKSVLGKACALLLLLPFTAASKCGKKPPPDEVIEDDDGATRPEVELQVISVEPNRVEPDQGFRALIFGSAFEEGARVWVGDVEMASVQVRDEGSIAMSVPPLSVGTYDVKVRNPDGTSAVRRTAIIARVDPSTLAPSCDLIRVQFDYDSSTLSSESSRRLFEHKDCFAEGSGQIRIEGHCDERGTTEYNIALGQRRAESVKKYLVGQGVLPSRLQTVSYGEERPIAMSYDEASWAKNRRADIQVGR